MTGSPKQPLSAKSYAVMALAGLVIGIGLLLFYVHQVPRLIETGTSEQVFYVLLIPWGLACAAFLFGAMRSYARLKSRPMPNTLELGGPVVVALLVVVGGYWLVPRAESFDLTVRAHAADDSEPRITSGALVLEYGNVRREERIPPNGDTDFKEIPRRFWGTSAKIFPQIEGYGKAPHQVSLTNEVLDIALERERRVSAFRGTIVPPPGPANTVLLRAEDHLGVLVGEGTADSLGRFSLEVAARDGDRVRLRIYVRGKLAYDDYQTLPGGVSLSIRPGTSLPSR